MCLWFRSRPNDGVAYVKKRKLIRDTRLHIIRKKNFWRYKKFHSLDSSFVHRSSSKCIMLWAQSQEKIYMQRWFYFCHQTKIMNCPKILSFGFIFRNVSHEGTSTSTNSHQRCSLKQVILKVSPNSTVPVSLFVSPLFLSFVFRDIYREKIKRNKKEWYKVSLEIKKTWPKL